MLWLARMVSFIIVLTAFMQLLPLRVSLSTILPPLNTSDKLAISTVQLE